MLKAMVGKYLISDDKSKPEVMYPPSEEEDMNKIRAYSDRKKPQNLQVIQLPVLFWLTWS